MIQVRNYTAAGRRIIPSKTVEEIADFAIALDLQGVVRGELTLVDVEFWRTTEERKAGPAGYCGCKGITGHIAKPARGELGVRNTPSGIPETFIPENAPPIIAVDEKEYVLRFVYKLKKCSNTWLAEHFSDAQLTKGPCDNIVRPLLVRAVEDEEDIDPNLLEKQLGAVAIRRNG